MHSDRVVAQDDSSAPPSPTPSAPASPSDRRHPLDAATLPLGSLYEELEVPQLINQINLESGFSHHIPPPEDKLPPDSELEDLATRVISEMDLTVHTGEAERHSRVATTFKDTTHDDFHTTGRASPEGFSIGEMALDHPSLTPNIVPSLPKKTVPWASSRSQRTARTQSDVIAEEVQRSGAVLAVLNKAATHRAAQAAAKSARASLMVGNSRKAFATGSGALANQLSMLQRRSRAGSRTVKAAQTGKHKDAVLESDEEQSDPDDDEDDDEVGSMCGFEDDEDERPSKHALAAAVSEKTAQRGKFMKKFTQALFLGDKTAQAKAKIEEIFNQNKELVKKAVAQETLKLLDPAMKFASKRAPMGHANFVVVREALAIKANIRSKASRELITDMFKTGCALSPYMTQCSEADLRALSEAAELRDVHPSYLNSEPMHVRGEVALFIYIIMHGSLKIAVYGDDPSGQSAWPPELARTENNRVAPPKEFRLLGPGDCLGEFVLNGVSSWTVDVNAPTTSPVSMCCIPLDVALRYIGRKGPDAAGAMVLFWKHHRLWQEIKQHNQDLLLHSKYKQAASPKKRQDIHFNFQPMNVIDAGRIKVYQPGMDIFTQGQPRQFLFLVVRGCAEYRRAFPPEITADGLMPASVEVGLTLLCGDFSFMDGEDHLWIEQMQEMDAQVTGSAAESDRVRERRMRRYCRFDTHKNSLVAVSRVEVVAVPMAEVAKCTKLFQRLIRLSTERYPAAFIASEELVRQHYESEKWKADRKDVIKDIVSEKEARQLNENWYTSVNNNVADNWYVARKPGGTTTKSTLQMVLEAAAFTSPYQAISAGGAMSVGTGESERTREQGSSKSSAGREPTVVAGEINSPRRVLLKNCIDYMAAEEMKAKTALEMSSPSGKYDSPVEIVNSLSADDLSDNEPETLVTPRPPQPLRRSFVAPAPPHRRPQSAGATTRSAIDGVPVRPQSATTASAGASMREMKPRCIEEEAPPLQQKRPHSAQRPRSATGRSRPYSANLAVRTSLSLEESFRAQAPPETASSQQSGASTVVTASPMPASSPRPHTTGSHRSLVEAHAPAREHVTFQQDTQAQAPPQHQLRPQVPPKLEETAVSKKVVQFSKLLPQFDFSDFACADDEEVVERREGSMKNPRFAEFDFTSAMLFSHSAKRQAQQEELLAAAGAQNAHNAAGSSRKARLKQRVHKQKIKSKDIDPDSFVQAYRDKLVDDPHRRFIDEFIKK